MNFRILGNPEAPDTQSPGKPRSKSLEPWPSVCGPGSAGSAAPGELLEAQMLQPHPDLLNQTFLLTRPRRRVCTFKSEKHWRNTKPRKVRTFYRRYTSHRRESAFQRSPKELSAFLTYTPFPHKLFPHKNNVVPDTGTMNTSSINLLVFHIKGGPT